MTPTRDDIIGFISDTYKSLNGIRPRFWNFSEMSVEELTEIADRLIADLDAELAREKAHNEEVLAAADNPSAFVEFDPRNGYCKDHAEALAKMGNYAGYTVFYNPESPKNNALADALKSAVGQ